MKKSVFQLFALAIVVVFFASSCKKCKVENVTINKGAVISDVNIYPANGYMTGNMGGNYAIGASHIYANSFLVEIDGGAKSTVDYGQYKILANPMTAKCNASYERNVVIDNSAQTVTYTITCEQCTTCDYEVMTENYVLVPTFPDTYTVSYVVNIVDKD